MNELQSIDALTAEILILKQQTAQNIIEIGKRLISVKESLPHGEWGKWLKEKVDFTDRTAQRFIKVANECSNPTTLSDLPKSKVFSLLDLPLEEREEFVKNNPVDEMTARELQAAIKEKKELEKKLKAEKVKSKKEIDEIKSKSKEEITNREVEIENLKIHIKSVENKLAEAETQDNNEEAESLREELNEKATELKALLVKVSELEKELKKKPIEVIAEIPEETKKELEELRIKASQVTSGNEPVVKFSIYFEEIVKDFKGILSALAKIENSEEQVKYKSAIRALIEKMSEKI
jgi:DNA repair exonuclease SbcCD ATPase subunit